MHIITNPVSRRGRGEKLAQIVSAALDEKGISYISSYTKNSEHATALARDAARSGEELVICIGGDGTLSAVAAGLCGTSTRLALISSGTGNDFARYLNIPENPLEALDAALNGNDREIDLGMANDRIFINTAGSGFDVATLRHTLYYKKFFHGLVAYVLGVLRALFGYSQMNLKIESENESVSCRSLLLSVANGRYFGGGMCVSPEADASDGLFDVIYTDEVARYKIPFLLSSFINGAHLKWPIIHHFKTSGLTVTTSDSSLQLDGEVFEEQTVHYKILPRALTVKVPATESQITMNK